MKPAPFAYHRPSTVDEAVGVLAEHGDEAKVLAGGQSLVPIMALRLGRYDHLVDLNRVPELEGISAEDGVVRIAAMTRQATVEHDRTVAERVPLLSRATPLVGHFQIRNRGTLGGAIAHADPAAEYPAVALALGATMEVVGPDGAREIEAEDFFQGLWSTALGPADVLAAVRFPARRERQGCAIEEVARRHGDFALVGAACVVAVDASGVVDRAAIAMFGVGSRPVRVAAAEAALVGASRVDDLGEIGRIAAGDLDPFDDTHASAAYRLRVGAVVVERAVERALAEAVGA